MGRKVGQLPKTDVKKYCPRKVTADVIQRQIRTRGAAFATSPDADILRAASKWVSDQYSWLLEDLQLAVYGRTCSWVFSSGGRANQVAFHASSDKIDEPAWERRGWRVKLYNGVKMALKVVGTVLPLAAPIAAAVPALGAPVAAGMTALGAGSRLISGLM